MKKLNALNLGKSLNRAEMKNINGGLEDPHPSNPFCNSGMHGCATTYQCFSEYGGSVQCLSGCCNHG